MSKKIGRNDSCPCGSGKKYKNCCLGKDKQKNLSSDLLNQVIGWISGQPEMKEEFEKVLDKFMKTDTVTDVTANNILDAFIFDHKLSDGETPFRYFLDHAKISPDNYQIYEGFERNIFSIFEVLEVFRGQGIKLQDLVWDKAYFVREKKATHQLTSGDILFCRIALFESHFIILTPAPNILRQDAGYRIKRDLRHMRPDLQKGMNAFDVLDAAWKSGDETNFETGDLHEIKKAFKKKLKSLGIEIDFRGLNRRINESKNVMGAFPEVCGFDFPSNDDFEETMDLLKLLWNRYPRKEFGGKFPDEVSSFGPKEQLLISDLLDETIKNVDPADYLSLEEAENAVDEFKDKWLKTSQKELGGRTPMDAILEERGATGNPDKNFTFDVKIEGIRDYDLNKAEKLYMDGVRALKRGALIKATELFKEVIDMYPEDYSAWGNLGCCFAYLGDKKEAIKCYKKSLSIEPDYEFGKKSLEWVKGQTEKQLFADGMPGTVESLMDDPHKKSS